MYILLDEVAEFLRYDRLFTTYSGDESEISIAEHYVMEHLYREDGPVSRQSLLMLIKEIDEYWASLPDEELEVRFTKEIRTALMSLGLMKYYHEDSNLHRDGRRHTFIITEIGRLYVEEFCI